MKHAALFLAMIVIALAPLANVSRAEFLVFQERGAFLSAISDQDGPSTAGIDVIDFEGRSADARSVSFRPTAPGVRFKHLSINIGNPMPGDGLNITGKDFFDPPGTDSSYWSDFLINSDSPMGRVGTNLFLRNMGEDLYAIGLDFGTFGGGAVAFKALVPGRTIEGVIANSPAFGSLGFFGLMSTTPIFQLRLSVADDEKLVLDDVTLSRTRVGDLSRIGPPDQAAVPEPSGVLATLTGLGLMLGARFRRRPRAA